jgi:hypothetical protein
MRHQINLFLSKQCYLLIFFSSVNQLRLDLV